jgi:cytochrome c oxidase assembly factor CtaG
MRASMATALWQFSTSRMLQEYVDHLYLPAAEAPDADQEPAAAGQARRSTS